MASFPCPYCGRGVARGEDDETLATCPSCEGRLDIAYRYRLVAHRGPISGGELYEALVEGYADKVAVLFVSDPSDADAVARFTNGNRLFAELGGGRGLIRVLELSSRTDRRAYVVMEWIAEGTLESRVTDRGPLDHPTLLEATGDLVHGLAKAHRSMPNLVHNHIHPGKIGFLSDDEIVLFGFEWAEQVFEQDSNLADSFLTDADEGPPASKRASDLRRLGQALYYAATGEWIAELSLAQQRERARSIMQGPMATFVDRTLSAGYGGYQTAVDAALDFERIVRGDVGAWRARILPKHRSRDEGFATAGSNWIDADEDPGMLELAAADYELAEDNVVASFGVGPTPAGPSASARSASMDAFDRATARAKQAQTQLDQQTSQASGAKVVRLTGVIIAVIAGLGMCVASIADDVSETFEEPAPRQRIEIPETEPIPRERVEPPSMPAPIEIPSGPARLDSIFRYEGKISGPENLAGFDVGDACTIWIEPNAGSLNCRWYIDCGSPAKRIYGGTAGYSTCEINEDGYPVRAADEEDDAPDGAFVAELDGPAPMIMVLDRWLLPPTRVAIQITQAGVRVAGPIPEVPQARRLPERQIERRIARDDWPEF